MHALIFAAAIAAPSAPAQNWVESARSSTFTDYVEVTGIRRSGPEVRFWHERRFDRPQSVGEASIDTSIALMVGNCDEMSYRIEEAAGTLRGRSIVPQYRAEGEKALIAEPGTVWHAALELACSR